MSNRDSQIAAKRKEFLSVADAQAQRALNDQRFDFLRTRSNRRRLVVATFASLLAYAVGNLLDFPILGLIALLLYFGLLLAMRTASRTIPDLPEELIDERMREVRGNVYRNAYIITTGILSAVIVLDITLTLSEKFTPLTRLSSAQWFDMMFVVFFAIIAVPSALFLWTEPEV